MLFPRLRHTLLAAALCGIALTQLSGCAGVVAAGAGAGLLITDDRRASSVFLMDEEIELKATNLLREKFGTEAHINVTSYNRRILLTGEVPSEALRAQIMDTLKSVSDIKAVQDELITGKASSYLARSNDAYLTAKVKTRLFDDSRFSAHHVKVVSEAGTVFLMGLLKKAEGEAAAEVASRTPGVKKVVKVLETIE